MLLVIVNCHLLDILNPIGRGRIVNNKWVGQYFINNRENIVLYVLDNCSQLE